MSLEVAWSPEANQDLWAQIDHLLNEWTEQEAKDFMDRVTYFTEIISNYPRAFQMTDHKDVHFVPIVPQVTMFYRVLENKVEILRLWSNPQDPHQLSL